MARHQKMTACVTFINVWLPIGMAAIRRRTAQRGVCMIWDQTDAFIIDFIVEAEHIDELGHANNAVYVSWLERCAWQHSQSLGLGLEDYRRLDRAMAVLRHEIDYLAAAYRGDRLQLATWIVDSDQRLKMKRDFQLVRPADGATLLRAQTTFVCIQLSNGKPKRMPAEFVEGYGKALVQPYPLEL
jgi:acyl-CoA thioester hydrolase